MIEWLVLIAIGVGGLLHELLTKKKETEKQPPKQEPQKEGEGKQP